jgi:hypothetical protein
MTNIEVKCVICNHRFDVPLTPTEPMCPKCFGPVIPVKVSTKAPPVGKL